MKKNILITGSSRGIGRAIAELAHEKGYRVILHGNSDSKELNSIHKKLSNSLKIFFDVADKKQHNRLLKRFSKKSVQLMS